LKFVTAAILLEQHCKPKDYDDESKRNSDEHVQFTNMLASVKVQALAWVLNNPTKDENPVNEFKHVFDEVFPGGKHRTKRPGVPELAAQLHDVALGKLDDKAKSEKVAELLNGEELQRFRESMLFGTRSVPPR
jgi:hypothetical protein